MHRPSPAGARRAPFTARRTEAPARRAAFTLVEVLIVVVILAILAATVLPQFKNASGQAEASAIKQNLSVVRSQIELYRVQHNDDLPGGDKATFLARMTAGTERDGTAGTTYGPYIRGRMPENPAAKKGKERDILFSDTAADDEDMPDSGEGWWYYNTTGEFRAMGETDYWTL